MKRAYSIKNVLNKKYKTLEFDGAWKAAIGSPELTGTWVVYGGSKNGKTSFCMKLTKYLTKFEKVLYNTIEEGISLSIKIAMEREMMIDVSGQWVIERFEYDDLIEYLSKRKSPNIVVIDSIQFMELNFGRYKELIKKFNKKLFIFISHVKGGQPDGSTATKILRNANVSFHVEGFRAFPQSRYGGGQEVVINEKLATEYWGKNQLKINN
jgi:hypothetical protein